MSEVERLERALTTLCGGVRRLRTSHGRLLVAAKVALTFMGPTGHARDMLKAAIAEAEELAP